MGVRAQVGFPFGQSAPLKKVMWAASPLSSQDSLYTPVFWIVGIFLANLILLMLKTLVVLLAKRALNAP